MASFPNKSLSAPFIVNSFIRDHLLFASRFPAHMIDAARKSRNSRFSASVAASGRQSFFTRISPPPPRLFLDNYFHDCALAFRRELNAALVARPLQNATRNNDPPTSDSKSIRFHSRPTRRSPGPRREKIGKSFNTFTRTTTSVARVGRR